MPMKVESMPEQALRSTTMQRAPWARQCSAQALTWGLLRKLPFPLQRIQEKSSNLAQSISLSGVTCVRAGFFAVEAEGSAKLLLVNAGKCMIFEGSRFSSKCRKILFLGGVNE